MAGDDARADRDDDQPSAPAAPSPEAIARLRRRAEQLRARDPRPTPDEPVAGEPSEDVPVSDAPVADEPTAEAAPPPVPPDDEASPALDGPDDPFAGLGADPDQSALLDRWAEDAPDEAVAPRRNWSPLVAVAIVVVVALAAFVGARALISGSADDDTAAGPGSDGASGGRSVLDEDAPTLEELTSDVTLPPGPDQGLQVASQGITVVPDRFDPARREGTYAVVLVNPHEGWLAQGVQVDVTFVDAAGNALGTDAGFVEVVLPAQRIAVASLFFDAPTVPVARMDVAVDVARWRETGPFEGAFTITDITTGEAEFSGVRTTFTIASGFDEPLTDVGVTAVYRAADGRIIGGYDTFVERLDPGVPTPAEIALLANVDPAEVAATELYATAAFGSVPQADGGDEGDDGG